MFLEFTWIIKFKSKFKLISAKYFCWLIIIFDHLNSNLHNIFLKMRLNCQNLSKNYVFFGILESQILYIANFNTILEIELFSKIWNYFFFCFFLSRHQLLKLYDLFTATDEIFWKISVSLGNWTRAPVHAETKLQLTQSSQSFANNV